MTYPTYPSSQLGDVEDTQMVEEVTRQAPQFAELGVTGLKRASGYVDEEFLPQLKGKKGVGVYREMGDNEPIVGALMFAIRQLLRNVDWPVTPAGKNTEAANAAKLLETCMEDMSHTWDDFVIEALSSLQYGWAWHEIVWKRRMGPWSRDGRTRSKYSDGLIGVRKLPIRAQETLQRWVFDDTGDVRAMIQLAPPTYKMTTIPIERSLLFRWGAYKNNPEGISILRQAYRPWFFKKRLEENESIGVERDLAGLPMASVPAEYLKARPGTDQAKMVEAMKRMVRSIRRNEQEGLVFPLAYDQDTKQPLFKFELLSSGGARQFQTDPIIQRYEQRILMTVLADWIMVGHQETGTYNMHVDKTAVFRTALNATAQMVADVVNRHLVPRLFAANGWRPAELPTISPSDVDAPNLTELVQFLSGTANLGFTWGPDADLERYLRNAAGLPPLQSDEEGKHRTLARREESIRMLDSQARVLAARSQLAQAQAQEELTAEGQNPDMAMQAAQMQGDAAQQQAAGEQQAQQSAFDQQRAQAEDTRTDQAHRVSMLTQLAQLTGGSGQGGGADAGGGTAKPSSTRQRARASATSGRR